MGIVGARANGYGFVVQSQPELNLNLNKSVLYAARGAVSSAETSKKCPSELFPLTSPSRNSLTMNGRDGQIRTDDFLLPKQALYQAELRPVMRCGTCSLGGNLRGCKPLFSLRTKTWTKRRE